jgi:large subunit ribosomal protein L13
MIQKQVNILATNLPKVKHKTVATNAALVKKEWFVIDARDLVLGRLAAQVAIILQGKHKPSYTPNVDCGDNVIIINAEAVAVTGMKEISKIYYRHTGFPGGIKARNVKMVRAGKKPTDLVKLAVFGMLGRGPLAYKQQKNIYIYAGEDHKHHGQKPVELNIATKNRKNNGN